MKKYIIPSLSFLLTCHLASAEEFQHVTRKDLLKKHNAIQEILEKIESKVGVPVKNELKNETSSITEEKAPASPKKDYIGDIVFRAKKSALWIQNSKYTEGKQPDDLIEIILPGELYFPKKTIKDVEKHEIDRKTIEDAVASAFSANKHGDLNWIVENFIEDEQKKTRFFFKDKNIIADSMTDANNIKNKYITGKMEYKDYIIVFVEQDYGNENIVTEAIVFKKEKDKYKISNALTSDDTYDLIFASISNGQIIPKLAQE